MPDGKHDPSDLRPEWQRRLGELLDDGLTPAQAMDRVRREAQLGGK